MESQEYWEKEKERDKEFCKKFPNVFIHEFVFGGTGGDCPCIMWWYGHRFFQLRELAKEYSQETDQWLNEDCQCLIMQPPTLRPVFSIDNPFICELTHLLGYVPTSEKIQECRKVLDSYDWTALLHLVSVTGEEYQEFSIEDPEYPVRYDITYASRIYTEESLREQLTPDYLHSLFKDFSIVRYTH